MWPEIYSISNSQFKLEANSHPVRNNPDPVKIFLSPVKKTDCFKYDQNPLTGTSAKAVKTYIKI